MPLTAVVNLGTNVSAGATTVTLSPSRDIQVGEFIVVLLSERDFGISTFADNSSQAGTANSYTQDRFNNFADPFTYIYSCRTTRKILSSDTFTATFAGSSGGKSITVLALPQANATTPKDLLIRNSATAGSTYDTGATGNSAQADEYFVGIAAFAASSVPIGTATAASPWTLQASGSAGSGYGYAAGSMVSASVQPLDFSGTWGASQNGTQTSSGTSYKGTSVTTQTFSGALTQSSSVSLTKQPGKVFAVSQSQTVALAKQGARTFALSQSQAVAFLKQPQKLFAVTATASPTIALLKSAVRAFSLSQSSTVALSKNVARTFTVSQTQSVALAKTVARTFAVTVTASVSLTKRAARSFALSAASAVSLAVVKVAAIVERLRPYDETGPGADTFGAGPDAASFDDQSPTARTLRPK